MSTHSRPETNRYYQVIEAVIQRLPYSSSEVWLAGYGYQYTDGCLLVGGGCYDETRHATLEDAKHAALEHARAYRNTVLTLGGCTFDTLPPIQLSLVGSNY